MAVDITALYCCLDDFCKVFADWEAHRLLPSEQTRQRSGKLSRAEMLFIVVLFHLSPYKNFNPDSPDRLGRQDQRLRKRWANCRSVLSPVGSVRIQPPDPA